MGSKKQRNEKKLEKIQNAPSASKSVTAKSNNTLKNNTTDTITYHM